jgi:hypothetical protein
VQKAARKHQILCDRSMTTGRLHCPATGRLVPSGIDDLSVERYVLPKSEDLIDMCHVLAKFNVVRETLREIPVLKDLRDIQLIERCLAVHTSARISVPVPVIGRMVS